MSREPVILRETAEWLVVDKPAGWHTVRRAGGDDAPTVEAWLRRTRPELGSLPEAGLVHRLDRSTSGCLLAAKADAARRSLREAISEDGGRIRKLYLAAVRPGIAAEGEFALHFRGRHKASAKVSVSPRGEPGELGRARWRRLDQGEADLVEVELLGPGRRHQIRAGLAHLGYPLAGDALYRGGPALPGLEGAALHALLLEVDGTVVTAPPPAPWNQFQEAIRRRLGGSSSMSPTKAG